MIKGIAPMGLQNILDEWFNLPREVYSYSLKGQFVDTDRYDIVPKRSYVDEEIKRIEEQIKTVDRQQEMSTQYYEGKRKELLEQKEALKRQREKK